jgi:multimeric flavodoxin WrbA
MLLRRKTLSNERDSADMKIEYFHASKFGNGAIAAEEFKRFMAAKDVTVNVHHIRDTRPKELMPADLYVFSSPGRFGKPISSMRRFLKKVQLPPGTMYAILTTEAPPMPDKKTGKTPTEEEFAKYERVRPIMNELLQAKGMKKVAEGYVQVNPDTLRGPLIEGWQKKVEDFAAQILAQY